MICTHIPGFPRIGEHRELKLALERHWRGEIDAQQLETTGVELRARHWQLQRDAGMDFVTVGDLAFYDQVANHITSSRLESELGRSQEALDANGWIGGHVCGALECVHR